MRAASQASGQGMEVRTRGGVEARMPVPLPNSSCGAGLAFLWTTCQGNNARFPGLLAQRPPAMIGCLGQCILAGS